MGTDIDANVAERFCRRCYYNLRGLPDRHKCPECGMDFDIADAKTFLRRPPSRRWKWLGRAVLALAAMGLLLGGPWLWMYWGWKQEQDALARLPGFRVVKAEPVGPRWLHPRLGRAGFVLDRVRELDLIGIQVKDISPAGRLAYLRYLDISVTLVEDLSPLARLVSLQALRLGGTPVQDLSPLASLSRLEVVSVGSTPVRDLSPLGNLRQIKHLDLVLSEVRDLRPLSGLRKLRSIDLRQTPIDDVSPLAGLPNLQLLDLGQTDVRDVSPLAQCAELRWLNLGNTKVIDAMPLAKLAKLEWLGLPSESFNGTQAEDLRRTLPNCAVVLR